MGRIALVIAADFLCLFCGTFIAGFVGGLLGVFAGAGVMILLTNLLSVPLIIILTQRAGRLLARRRSPPTRIQLIIGGVIFTITATALAGLAHPAAGAVSLVASSGTSFLLYRSVRGQDLSILALLRIAWKARFLLSGAPPPAVGRK